MGVGTFPWSNLRYEDYTVSSQNVQSSDSQAFSTAHHAFQSRVLPVVPVSLAFNGIDLPCSCFSGIAELLSMRLLLMLTKLVQPSERSDPPLTSIFQAWKLSRSVRLHVALHLEPAVEELGEGAAWDTAP